MLLYTYIPTLDLLFYWSIRQQEQSNSLVWDWGDDRVLQLGRN
jgi:hypothetical protein